ncbi:uncharacterized protein LOC105631442 isoform X2 [Jatropha curcas]|uniref:uncharacterized protein LOC105631442 isoform X2 n=1 Tax=Jatropha curcas TaxID=180498 RepID=UPI0005FBE15A|nr:uncharacterized protein LOC105631442 isoform X2 [Jatropha curcas]
MATKNLIRTGASLMNRMFLSNPVLHQNPNTTRQVASHGFEITPQLFPSLSKFQISLNFPQNDAHSINRLSNEGFLHPCGLPSLGFFLPEGDSSSEPMFLIKRTFQPSILRRKRNHGFFARQPRVVGELLHEE